MKLESDTNECIRGVLIEEWSGPSHMHCAREDGVNLRKVYDFPYNCLNVDNSRSDPILTEVLHRRVLEVFAAFNRVSSKRVRSQIV